MDLFLPQFPTADLLGVVPRVSEAAFKQWIFRSHVVLSSAGKTGSGRPTLHTAADVIQVAFVHRLATQGVSPGLVNPIWRKICHLLDDWRNGPLHRDRLALIHFDSKGGMFVKVVPEATFGDYDPSWPDVQFMFRFDRFVRHTVACLAKQR